MKLDKYFIIIKRLTGKKANRLDSDAYESRIDGKVEELRAIHDELNAGKDYGRKTFELMLRKYLESLEVIE